MSDILKIMGILSSQNSERTGGWVSIQIASLAEITFCPAILTNTNANLLQISGNEDTIDVLPIPEKFSVNVSARKTKIGTTYNVSISLDFSEQSAALDSYLNLYKNKKVIVLGIDTNQNVKIFGSKNHPLNFSYQEIQGKKLEDSSITRVTVNGSIGQKPVYLQ